MTMGGGLVDQLAAPVKHPLAISTKVAQTLAPGESTHELAPWATPMMMRMQSGGIAAP